MSHFLQGSVDVCSQATDSRPGQNIAGAPARNQIAISETKMRQPKEDVGMKGQMGRDVAVARGTGVPPSNWRMRCWELHRAFGGSGVLARLLRARLCVGLTTTIE